jgi:hypothetical protein
MKIKYFTLSNSKIRDILLSYGEKGYTAIVGSLMNTYFLFLHENSSSKLLEVAVESIIEISKYLKKEDITEKVLTHTISKFVITTVISNIDSNDELKVQAIKIFFQICIPLGRDLTERYVVPQLFCLSEDIDFRVRKELMSHNFINVCNVVSQNCFKNKLLPIYLK